MPVKATMLLALALAVPAAEGRRPRTLAPAARDRLDRQALDLPGDGLERAAFRSIEGLPVGLLAGEGMTAEQEAGRAAAALRSALDGAPEAQAPAKAQAVFERLVGELPPHLNPNSFRWRFVVLDATADDAFALGGGIVCIDRPQLDALLADPDRGEAALAFVLADEIGRIALGHTRRAWELQASLEALAGHAPFAIPPRAAAAAIGARDPAGHFAYTALEAEEADRFALHLCRNAGFDLDAALDPVRARAQAELAEHDDGPARRPALERLRRLLAERDGLYDDETTHGLFIYDRASGRLGRCGPRQVGPGQKCIVLIHGLRGNQYALEAYLTTLGKRADLADRAILFFRYPNNDSLSRSGQFLTREMRRCLADPDKAFFVCHSAGGLVFRWYAEVNKGAFDRAVLLAVPNAGSTMAEFKVFVDLGRFVIDVPDGLDFALEDAFSEGDGQIALDLHPDSLFLRRLGREPHPVGRYQVFYGTFFDFWQSLKLQAAYVVAKLYVEEAVSDLVPFPATQARLLRLVERTPLPEEVTHGDLAVSARSACLPGVAKTTGLGMMHEQFRFDPDVMRQVGNAIAGR